jgi:hypothetical protein
MRHLLYHLLPARGNGRWQQNLKQLRKYIHLFDGVKVVAIMCETDTRYNLHCDGVNPGHPRIPLTFDPPEAVERELEGLGCEFIRLPNDPNLREVLSHEALFSRLAEVYKPGDVALWAHCKGVTYSPGHMAGLWAQTMAEAMLGYWPVVSEVLETYPVAGCFKKYGHFWKKRTSSRWMYSGSWFWFRCEDLFTRDWKHVDRFWSGIEAYPAQHFESHEGGVVFFDGKDYIFEGTGKDPYDLYDRVFWNIYVRGEWLKWKHENKDKRT